MEIYFVQLKKMQNHPFIQQLYELYNFGKTDLQQNILAIDLAQGNLQDAYNNLSKGQSDEPIIDPYMQKVQQVKYPQKRKDLEHLYSLKFTNFEDNLHAIIEAKGDLEVATKILLQKQSSSNQVDFAKISQIQSSKMNSQNKSQKSFEPQNSSKSKRDSILQDCCEKTVKPQQAIEDQVVLSLSIPPEIQELDKLQQQLRDQLKQERMGDIDEIIVLLINMFEQENNLSNVKARKTISRCQEILSTKIQILKVTTRQLLFQLQINEDFTLEDIEDLIDKRSVILKNAEKMGETNKKNQISNEIDQYLKIKDNFEEILRLEKAKNGDRDLSEDPKTVYPALPLEKRLSLLSKLLKKETLDVYSELLRNDSDLKNSDAFQEVLNSIRSLIEGAKWDRVSLGIFKIFLKGDVKRHYAMKIFLMNEQSPITSPLLTQQAFEAIKKINVPSQCQDCHLELVDNFTRLSIEQINVSISDIAKEFEAYKAQLVEIMQPLKSSSPKFNPQNLSQQLIIEAEPSLDKYLIEFEAHFLKYEVFQRFQEALYNKDFIAASPLIKKLIEEIVGNHSLESKFCEMYTLIIKANPGFLSVLSEENVFHTFAPNNLKNTVTQLFQQLKIQVHHAGQHHALQEELKVDFMNALEQHGGLQKIITEMLQEIFLEDANFNIMLRLFLSESINYAKIVRPYFKNIKSLKNIQQEHLGEAYSQIESKGRDPQGIAEFMAVDIDMDLQDLQEDIGNWYINSQKLNGKTMTLVLYDLIKKRCSFEKFITLLSQNSKDESLEIPFTQQFFLSYLLNNSDTYLRTMILMACSFFMPLPLVSYQPKQQNCGLLMRLQSKDQLEKDIEKGGPLAFVESQSQFIPFVYEELFYCFEKHMAVLAFKVSANPNKSPQGCTSLTNYVFNRTFQTHSKSLVNYGSIEIQFDYNFEHPMFVPVADAHGLVEESILENVYSMFEVFLIHSFVGAEHQSVVQQQISKIHQKKQNPLIFLIIHDDSRRENNFKTSQDGKIVKIMLSRYSDLLEIPKAKMRNTILQHYQKHIGDFKAYESDIDARLKSLKEFSDFNSRFQAQSAKLMEGEEENLEKKRSFNDQRHLEEALDIITTFLGMIEENKEQLRSDKVLKMNFLFEEACRLDKIMIRETSLKTDLCEQYRLKVEQLYQEMKNSMPSPLTLELEKIINNQNYLGLTSIISKLIRSFLNFHLQPLLKQREELRTRVQKTELKPNEKDIIFKQIKEITKKLQKSQFSNEFLYREYYISEHSKQRGSQNPSANAFNQFLSLANLQISQGQPFEIIDGNNLQFIKEVYQMIDSDHIQQDEILVLSVIGPQSSGKSLLLNTLFGTQFLSSAGRCTRGIYGCLIDINSSIKQTQFKKILILDTEGIQSTEALDQAFDKRVVFYTLCVSHVVLICNKGEMNKNMEETIKLATDCIMQVREEIDQQPQVNIIMNNVHINEKSLYDTIQSLSNSIMEMKRHEKLRQIFTIDESNVFLLPNAFAQSGNEQFVAYQPSYQFAQKVDQLRHRIFTYMQYSNKQDKAQYTLESWFQFAQKFWDFTDNYAGLTQYSTLEERKEDVLLIDLTQKLIAENFEDPQMVKKHEKMIYQEVTQVLDQHQGFDQTNLNVIKLKIDNVLLPRIEEVKKKIEDEFNKFINEKGFSPQIKKRRVEQLLTQIKQHFFNWQQIVQKLLGEFNQNRSQFIGDKSLQNAIDGYIQANYDITPEKAEKIFMAEWEKIEIEMKKQLRSQKIVAEEQFVEIGDLYRSNSRSIINIDQERDLLSQYQDLDGKILLKYLCNQKSFFFFNSKTIKPSIEKFKEQIVREKHFLKNKLEYFEENNAQEYYDWKKLIEERFKFGEYEKTLIAFCSRRDEIIYSQWDRKEISETKVNSMISYIRNEASNFNLDITDYFEKCLFNIEKTKIQPFIIKMREQLNKQSFSGEDENIFVTEVIRQHVNALKNNIGQNFKYRIGVQRNRHKNQFRFFDCLYVRDKKSSDVLKKDFFYQSKYNVNLDPQDQRIYQKDGLEPIKKRKINLKIKAHIRNQDQYFSEYLEFLIQSDICPIASATMPVQTALKHFFDLIDHEKLVQSIQQIVLDNILKKSNEYKHKTVEELAIKLIRADDPIITQMFCTMDFKTLQRVVVSVEGLIQKINEDMEPYSLIVSEQGSCCLHQIAQTYIIRIMQEIIRLTEHAPLLSFIKTKNVQRDLFIAKLTSNDKEIDIKLAERTGRHFAEMIVKQVKDEQIQAFQGNIACEYNLFKLKTVIKNIEDQVLQYADGILPNPFDIQNQPSVSWFSGMKKLVGIKEKQKQEEEKKEDFKDKMSKFKKLDVKTEFTPEEIIMFYVQPIEFLKKKFNDQWNQLTNIEIEKAQERFDERINQININLQKYFQCFQSRILSKNIQLATNVFIPIGQDQLSSQNIVQQALKVQCKKAMAIYLGLVVTKNWKVGTAISVDDQVKMIVSENLSLVTHEEIGIELFQPYADILQKSIQNELISNIQNFIQCLMSEIRISLDKKISGSNSIALQENDLIGNLFQILKTKTLGCEQMCPLCRRQCDQAHDSVDFADRIHSCEEGHQIQGLGGNRLKLNNRAITYGCHELVEEDTVVWQGNDMKWKKFLEVIYNDRRWDLEDKNLVDKNIIKEKNIKIWNVIGPLICDYYRLEQKIEIQFLQAQMDAKRMGYVQNTLYVLMLDTSQSMRNQDQNGQSKWGNLKSAVSQFIANIDKDIRLKNSSKISIITYNSIAKLNLEAQVPSQSLISSLKNPFGGTNFNPPLLIAEGQMEKYKDKFDSFVLVMMSDGNAAYPNEGVEKIKKSPAKTKLKFKSIGYGKGTESLTKMAKELGGTCEKALHPNQLSSAFIQMIPHLYSE